MKFDVRVVQQVEIHCPSQSKKNSQGYLSKGSFGHASVDWRQYHHHLTPHFHQVPTAMPRPHRLLHMGSRTVSAGVDVANLMCCAASCLWQCRSTCRWKDLLEPPRVWRSKPPHTRESHNCWVPGITHRLNVCYDHVRSGGSSLVLFVLFPETTRDTRRLL